jgi:hypothetical protein
MWGNTHHQQHSKATSAVALSVKMAFDQLAAPQQPSEVASLSGDDAVAARWHACTACFARSRDRPVTKDLRQRHRGKRLLTGVERRHARTRYRADPAKGGCLAGNLGGCPTGVGRRRVYAKSISLPQTCRSNRVATDKRVRHVRPVQSSHRPETRHAGDWIQSTTVIAPRLIPAAC